MSNKQTQTAAPVAPSFPSPTTIDDFKKAITLVEDWIKELEASRALITAERTKTPKNRRRIKTQALNLTNKTIEEAGVQLAGLRDGLALLESEQPRSPSPPLPPRLPDSPLTQLGDDDATGEPDPFYGAGPRTARDVPDPSFTMLGEGGDESGGVIGGERDDLIQRDEERLQSRKVAVDAFHWNLYMQISALVDEDEETSTLNPDSLAKYMNSILLAIEGGSDPSDEEEEVSDIEDKPGEGGTEKKKKGKEREVDGNGDDNSESEGEGEDEESEEEKSLTREQIIAKRMSNAYNALCNAMTFEHDIPNGPRWDARRFAEMLHLYGTGSINIAMESFIVRKGLTRCHYHTLSDRTSKKNDDTRDGVTGVHFQPTKVVSAPIRNLRLIPDRLPGTIPRLRGAVEMPKEGPSGVNGLSYHELREFFPVTETGRRQLHCGCDLQEALTDFFFWKGYPPVNVRDLYAYDKQGNRRTKEDIVKARIRRLWDTIAEDVEDNMVLKSKRPRVDVEDGSGEPGPSKRRK